MVSQVDTIALAELHCTLAKGLVPSRSDKFQCAILIVSKLLGPNSLEFEARSEVESFDHQYPPQFLVLTSSRVDNGRPWYAGCTAHVSQGWCATVANRRRLGATVAEVPYLVVIVLPDVVIVVGGEMIAVFPDDIVTIT